MAKINLQKREILKNIANTNKFKKTFLMLQKINNRWLNIHTSNCWRKKSFFDLNLEDNKLDAVMYKLKYEIDKDVDFWWVHTKHLIRTIYENKLHLFLGKKIFEITKFQSEFKTMSIRVKSSNISSNEEEYYEELDRIYLEEMETLDKERLHHHKKWLHDRKTENENSEIEDQINLLKNKNKDINYKINMAKTEFKNSNDYDSYYLNENVADLKDKIKRNNKEIVDLRNKIK